MSGTLIGLLTYKYSLPENTAVQWISRIQLLWCNHICNVCQINNKNNVKVWCYTTATANLGCEIIVNGMPSLRTNIIVTVHP